MSEFFTYVEIFERGKFCHMTVAYIAEYLAFPASNLMQVTPLSPSETINPKALSHIS